MQCEMCGKEYGSLFLAEVEGVNLKVCKECSRFGKVIRRAADNVKNNKGSKNLRQTASLKEKKDSISKDIIEYIMHDYSSKIRSAREKLNLTQKVFAMKLNEKESLINSIERGKRKPSLDLARKLEKFLNIQLIDTFEADSSEPKQRSGSDALTIGDIISLKNK